MYAGRRKYMRKTSKVIFGLMATSLLGLSACNKGPSIPEDPKTPTAFCYTYMDYTTVSPSNWNELTYQDNNDTQIMSRIGGSFFTFNYEFDADGEIVDGGFTVDYDGATSLEDVSALIGKEPGSGYAYKITLRRDLKWDDGSPIKAADFVYSMKQQLDPAYKNYRADSFYNGSLIIHNAKNYAKIGDKGFFASTDVYDDYASADSENLYFHTAMPDEDAEDGSFEASETLFDQQVIEPDYYASVTKNGLVACLSSWYPFEVPFTQEEIDSLEGKTVKEIKESSTLSAIYDNAISYTENFYGPAGEDLALVWCVSEYEYPEISFDKVGIFADGDYDLYIVLDSSLDLLKPDGTLSYKAAYNLSSLPLVKESLYENCRVAPATEGALPTSRYNSSVETSASWGPYKLTYFQAGKQYILERNENWYGYNMKEYKGQYQTDRIVCNTIEEWNTAWLSFQQGNITSIGIDVSISQDYKSSSRAVFTGDDYVASLQLQSSKEGLKNRETAGVDKEMLLYPDFRKALSLAIDRADYTAKCTTASQPGFGIFNEYHYYDVENAGVYRHTDAAKKVICETYGVNIDDYDSLDEAYAAVTGYNLELAKQLIDSAYDEAVAAGTIAAGDKVVLTVGSSADSEATRRQFNYLKNAFETLAVGTKLEGRLTLEFDASFGSKWATDFRAGAYDICTGGWSGAAWDPGYFLLAYLSPDYMYSKGWDTSHAMLTYDIYQDGSDVRTMSLLDWYDCLNDNEGAAINLSEGHYDTDLRLGLIAAIEGEILKVYYTVPLYNFYSAALLSYKVNYGSTTYNTFMGYGGLRYMTYNYDDLAWSYVKTAFDYKA